MSLPIRTTIEDINAVCNYLITKPTGATITETKAVVDKRHVDGRKQTALKFWGLIESENDKIKVTGRGRLCVRDSGSLRGEALRQVIREVRPYLAVVERASLRHEYTITATELAAHWHEHFKSDVAGTDKILNDQAVCFFHLAQGADLGQLTIGRSGKPTRFDFDAGTTRAFVHALPVEQDEPQHEEEQPLDDDLPEVIDPTHEKNHDQSVPVETNRVFITHGKNQKILNQVKELVTFGKLDPVVTVEHETPAKPVPLKVMEDMRSCKAAVIHVDAESFLLDEEGNEVPQINGNVLIEVGAAMALYGEKFILLVEEGVVLPSNLQGLYECRYQGDELNWPAARKLLKAFNEF